MCCWEWGRSRSCRGNRLRTLPPSPSLPKLLLSPWAGSRGRSRISLCPPCGPTRLPGLPAATGDGEPSLPPAPLGVAPRSVRRAINRLPGRRGMPATRQPSGDGSSRHPARASSATCTTPSRPNERFRCSAALLLGRAHSPA